MHLFEKCGGHRSCENGDINSYINSYMNTLEKAEFNASVRHIENTRILIYTDSEVPATAGSRKTTTKRKTQSNETNEKCYADNPANAIILWNQTCFMLK